MDNKSSVLIRLVCGLIGTCLSASATAAVSISTTPLFISSSVKPNVMLQFDNSGSMANIIWDSRYSPTTNYSNTSNNHFTTSLDNDLYYCPNNARFYSDCLRLPSPLGTSTRYEPNYLDWIVNVYGDSGNLSDGEIPTQARIQVARDVASQIVADNDNVNFGLARFNPPFNNDGGFGGTIVAECGASPASVQQAISQLGPDTNTPLSETYYEITRYFRGLSRGYGSGNGNYNSPIRYRCQRNFVITITDGLPTYDFPSISNNFDPDLPGPENQSLPDWDQRSPNTNNAPYPPFSDGTGENINVEGSTLFLDDLAKFGYDIDLKKSGTDETGGSYEDPEYDPQRLETYTIGFNIDNQMLEDAAEYGNGQYFTANNFDELTAALQGALSNIADKTSTAASLSATSTQASTETRIFRATFNSGTWLGELGAFQFGDDPFLNAPIWRASENLPTAAQRNIYTLNAARTGVAFEWDQVGDQAQQALGSEAVLDYIRGSNANTESQDGLFRDRASLLGDIVHSTPAFAGDEDFGYELLPGAAGNTYFAYVQSKSDIPDTVFVGVNDGMLHAFDADTGQERFAYVPRQVFGNLAELTEPGYGTAGNTPHRYFVDGSPALSDAYIGGAWRTIAVTTLGRGGKGIFGLDVSDAAGFSASDDILWELDPGNITNAPGASGPDNPGRYLGVNMESPAIVRLESGDWVALIGNGYNSQRGRAALLVVDLATGQVLDVLDTRVGNDNGLGPPAAIDRDRNGSVDTVYAGDLKGNLWKFDLSSTRRADWQVSYGRQPLFTAVDDGGSRQPITSRADVVSHPQGGVIVVFGTGKYLSTGDTESTDEQSVYGIWDVAGARDSDGVIKTDAAVPGINSLQEQTIVVQTQIGGRDVRVLSRNSVDYSSARGWVFDLSRSGERITRDVQIFDGKAVLVSTIPAPDPCSFGGDSALIEINPLNGTQFLQAILDINNDGQFDEGDSVTVNFGAENGDGGANDEGGVLVYPGIVDLDVGLATNPYILTREDGNQTKLVTGSNLGTRNLGEKGFLQPGRASWLQLR